MYAALFLPALLTIAAPRPEFKLTREEQTALKALEPFGIKASEWPSSDFPYGTILEYQPVIGFERISRKPIVARKPEVKDLLPLTKLTRVRRIEFCSAPVNDKVLDLLQDMTQLQSFDLRGTGITDEGLRKLAGLRRLKSLHLEDTNISDHGLKALAEFPALAHLSLSRTQVTGLGLKALEDNRNLTFLYLGENEKIGDRGIESLGKMPNLATLALGVTDEGLKAMAKPGAFPKLTLLMPGGAITGNGVKVLHDPKVFPSLKRIIFGRTKATEEDIKALLEVRPGLEIITSVPGEGVRFWRAKPIN